MQDLKCEYRVNPIGIDVTNPRLSWVLDSNQRGTVQTAYQIIVASSEENLTKDKGDLWDSGKVESDQSIHVAYAGSPLKSRQGCFWKVRTWDNHSADTNWSKPAYWTMGLLEASDWKAKWIGLDEGTNPDFFADAQWIWSPDECVPGSGATWFFRRTIAIAEEREISDARITLSTHGKFSIWINGELVVAGGRTIFCPVSEIDIEKFLTPGTNTIMCW